MRTPIATLALALPLLFACSGGGEGSAGATAPALKATTQKVELACAGCIYKMADADGCEAAVKIDGKPLKVTGVEFDAHGAGLCSAAKQAEVAGKVVGDAFVATSLKVLP